MSIQCVGKETVRMACQMESEILTQMKTTTKKFPFMQT